MQVGDKVPLSLQIADYAQAKFVRVNIVDDSGSDVAASPIDLTDLGDGLYEDFSYTFPDSAWIRIQYLVFDDAGYTTLCGTEGASNDIIYRDPPYNTAIASDSTQEAGFTQSQLIAIEAAITNGSLRVKYQDREVEYRSMEELLKVRDLIRKDLGITSGRNKRIFSEFSRGF